MMKKKVVYSLLIIGILFAYAVAPFIAGALEAGERRGPIVYPKSYHTGILILGCEAFNGYKPREGIRSVFYKRAIFYGFPERPYPKEKRLEMLQNRRDRGFADEIMNAYIRAEATIPD